MVGLLVEGPSRELSYDCGPQGLRTLSRRVDDRWLTP